MSIYHLLNRLTPEKSFCALALFVGLLLLIIIPPFEVPDEPQHFFRVYQISEGTFIGEKINNLAGGYIPNSIVEMSNDIFGQSTLKAGICRMKNPPKYSKDKFLKYATASAVPAKGRQFVDFKNTILYCPVVYAPQVFGFLIAKIANLQPIWYIYFGRLFNLLAFVFIVYYAIKLTPIYKWGFVLISLMPMTIAQVVSLSADTITIAVCFLIIAKILNCALSSEKERIDYIDVGTVAVLSLILGLCKSSYVLVPFLFLIIPVRKFSSYHTYIVSILIVVFSTFSGLFIWSLLIKNIYLPMRDGVNPGLQFHYIVNYPQLFLFDFFKTFKVNLVSIVKSFVGVLGWLNTPLPRKWIAFYLCLLWFCGLFESRSEIKVSVYSKIISGVILFFSIFIVTVMIYMSWNKIGAPVVEGLQGRYFIPIAPLLFIPFYNNYFCVLFNKMPKLIFVKKTIPLFICIVVLVSFFVSIRVILEKWYL
jgi:uncharacterized membrane protein